MAIRRQSLMHFCLIVSAPISPKTVKFEDQQDRLLQPTTQTHPLMTQVL